MITKYARVVDHAGNYLEGTAVNPPSDPDVVYVHVNGEVKIPVEDWDTFREEMDILIAEKKK